MRSKYQVKDNRKPSSPQLREEALARMQDATRAYLAAKAKRDEIRRRLLTDSEYVAAFDECRRAEIAQGQATREAFHYRFEVHVPHLIGILIAGKGDSRIEAIEDAKKHGH